MSRKHNISHYFRQLPQHECKSPAIMLRNNRGESSSFRGTAKTQGKNEQNISREHTQQKHQHTKNHTQHNPQSQC